MWVTGQNKVVYTTFPPALPFSILSAKPPARPFRSPLL